MPSPALQPAIQPLPSRTSTPLRSSLVIPTLPSVLSELAQNALDAGASKVECHLDLTRSGEMVRVEDDGWGMARESLRKVGGRYGTSKRLGASRMGSIDSYGYRGEALSSIAALGLLEITTRSDSSRHTYTKLIKTSKTLFEGVSSRSMSSAHGTIVTVRDLFHNIPVRQASLSQANPQTTLQACKKVIETLALARPHVKWTLWEERGVGTSLGGGSKRVMSITGGKTSVEVFRQVYGTAGVEKVQKIRVSSGMRRIDGFISLEGAVTRGHQHLFINGYPMSSSDLHHAISRRFAHSRFSSMTQDGTMDPKTSPHKRRSPRRLERHPIYVLNLTLPPNEVDVGYDPRKGKIEHKDEDAITAFVLAVVDEFLKRHQFANPVPPPTTETSPSRPPSRASAAARTASIPTKRPHTPTTMDCLSKRSRISTPLSATPGAGAGRTTRHAWIDQLVAELDTGVLPFSRSRSPLSASPSKRPILAVRPPLSADASQQAAETSKGHSICSHCSSPVAQATTSDTTPLPPIAANVTFPRGALSSAKVFGQVDKKFIACVLSSVAATAEPGSSEKTLVLIDQHAADERVSVEAILQELCEGFMLDLVAKTPLTKGEPYVILSREEGEILRREDVLDVLKRWGIELDTPNGWNEPSDYIQVAVKAVPTALLSRLGRKEASEITRLVKLYLPFLDESMGEVSASMKGMGEDTREGESRDWGRAMRFMPKEMLDLANSKACRGAIMFEDSLDLDQCTRLVRRLAEARFPFMCAHGRPSLVPLRVIPDCKAAVKRKIDWGQWSERRKKGQV